ncbi:GyrI-like domain-containing protein [Actinomyces massiliensis]|uniref:GyrI-like small molecule binding domain protein n=1 Tax=Actinomyces massiliensis F0489 TaxID=1125718 RepID=J1HLR6_9ACTO|nr:GyrI-like domain-containing protein [Actinomyces massiliensis]EJF46915.1 GyrI-like small molecule binding domain protein [Actinomyces massiliensis F0489]WLD71895.1 GyrI-like domain-containing protein [Actinomyces massiliensis]
MRAEQYQRQLDAVTDYIYAHLDDDLSLDRLADVSGFSPYHWHRIYRAVRGETAAQTVRRLRLERAAAMLAQNAWPLERIARRAGFTSTDAFSRAFQRAYDRTPGRFRSDRAGGPNGTGGSRRPAVIPDAESPTPYPVRVEERSEYRLAVAEHRGAYMDIGWAFARVVDRMGARKPRVAIYEDDPGIVPEAALRAAAGVVVGPEAEVPEDLETRVVPAGRYAVMRYTGPYSSMHAAYLWLYGQWLPTSGHEPRNHPVVEEYLTDPATTPPAQAVTDILLPLC